MKKCLLRLSVLMMFALFSHLSYGQILAWQFSLPEPTNGKEKSIEATTIDENLDVSFLSRGIGAFKTAGNSRGFGANLVACDTYGDAKATGAYFQFTVKAKKDYKVSLRNLSTIMRRQEEAANKYIWTYSLDGKTFKEIGEPLVFDTAENTGTRQPRITLSDIPELQNVPYITTITFRVYAWGGTTNTGKKINFGIGKSGSKGNPALSLFGTVEKIEK